MTGTARLTSATLPQAGGCACGRVRYRLTGAPLLAYACHCHLCQSRTGSAFSLTLVVRSADLAHEGPAETERRQTPSDRAVDDTRCPHCRTPLTAVNPMAPDYASIRAGTLDDAGWVVPIAQTWVESAIPWAVIPGVRHVAWADFDFVALGRDWQATAPQFSPAG